MTEYFETGTKKGRGMKQRSLDLIEWDWIVDENRSIERVPTWDEPEDYARCEAETYRRDFWDQQPHRVQVWSEKGTVRGLLAPALDHYAVGFLPVHGFTSATTAHDIAEDDDGRDLIVLYVGDFDPSGLFMSEADLPARFARYDGDHVKLTRIALTVEQLEGLPSFLAAERPSHPSKRQSVVEAHAPRAYRAMFKRFFLCALAALTAGALLAAIVAVETAFYLRSLID